MQKINLKENRAFCILPFIHLHINENNDIKPCCIGDKIGSTKYTKDFNFNTNIELQEIRQKMLAGERVATCTECYKLEDAGTYSSRSRETDDWVEKLKLEYFEDTWINLIKQFREDVLPAEELQIKQFITIDILINRSMKERKRHIEETAKLQGEVDKEYNKPEDTRDVARLMNLETQLSFARNSIANYTNEYTKLLNEQQKISKDLKATREQRIKRVEDGKSSWVGLIRMLEDEEIREREGKEMAIIGLATDRSKSILQQYHNFQDNTIDRPFLTSETVTEISKDEK